MDIAVTPRPSAERQPHGERAADSGRRLHRELSVVRDDDRVNDRQAEPRAPASPVRAASSRTNGSKMRSASAGFMPTPVSVTATTACSPSRSSESSTVPPACVYLIAFSTRLTRARRSVK